MVVDKSRFTEPETARATAGFTFYSPECAGGIARKSTAPRQRFTTVGTVGHSKAFRLRRRSAAFLQHARGVGDGMFAESSPI